MQLTMTIEGNLAADPVLRYLEDGTPVANFRVLHTARTKSNTTGEWVDGRTTAVDVTAWRGLAERVMESLRRGDTVTVTGSDPRAEAYLSNNSEARATLRLTASAVSLSLRYRTASSGRSDNAGQ